LNAFPAKYEVAAALGMVFTAISLVLGLALTFTRTALPAGRFAVVGGKGHKPAPVKLGRWRWAVGGFVATLVVLSVVLPYAVIAWMALTPNLFSAFSLSGLSLANFAYLFGEYGSLARIAGNSLALAAGESATVLAIAASAAYFVHRTRWRVGRGFGLAIYLTSLVPSVAFITGVIWAWIRAPIPLYGTLVLVGMAQAARSLPVAFRNLGDALRQIEPALEEVASTCGAGRARRFAAVTLPLVRPVLLGTFAIVFLSSMRDLNTQLFLASGTTESLTLPVVIFNFWSESRVGESAALTLVVLVLTLVVFLPVYRLVPRAL
jgi:iron(III) transport system permease protein